MVTIVVNRIEECGRPGRDRRVKGLQVLARSGLGTPRGIVNPSAPGACAMCDPAVGKAPLKRPGSMSATQG
jgi:hypothetical protein